MKPEISSEVKEAWLVDYADQSGERHIKTFKKKKAAAYAHQAGVDIRAGTHTPVSKSITVWRRRPRTGQVGQPDGREASTLAQYRQHAADITQRIGNLKLASLTTPRVNTFRDDLLASVGGMSRAMARKVLSSLKSLLRDARRRGNVAQNVALAVKIKANSRDKRS